MALDAGSVAGAHAPPGPPGPQETINSYQGYGSLTRDGGYGFAQAPAVGGAMPFDNEYPAGYVPGPGMPAGYTAPAPGHPLPTMASQYLYEPMPARPGQIPSQSEASAMNTRQSNSNGGMLHGVAGPGEGGYPYNPPTTLLDAVTKPPPPPQATSEWQVHYTSDGRPYYYNSVTKETTWDAPL